MQTIFSRGRRFIGYSNFTERLSEHTLSFPRHPHSHRHQPFTSLVSPSRSPQQTRLPGSASSSSSSASSLYASLSWRSQKFHGFLTNPLVAKQLLSKVASRANFGHLVDSRVGFFGSRLPRTGFEFGGYSRFQRRGWKSWFQGLSTDEVVYGLIIANVAVFVMWRVVDRQFMVKNFMISLDNFRSGRVHTLITSAFSHMDAEHIVSNMIGLYFFGINIGRTMSPQYLLKLYLAGALGGSVFYLIHHALMAASFKGQGTFVRDPSRTPGLGASGAVNAIMLLEIFLHPKATIYFELFIPVPAMLLGIFLIGKDVFRIIKGDSNISGSAHLGGAAVAAIAWARLRKGGFRF